MATASMTVASATTTKFSSLPLSAEMLSNLESLGYNEMTPIQAQSLPFILQGQDVIAKAKTGMVCYDYQNKKVTAVPEVLRTMLQRN